VDYGIGRRTAGSSSTLTGHGKQHANARSPRRQIGLFPSVACVPSVLPATLGANGERWYVHGRRSYRCTPESRIASFGNPGNGHYREELRWAKAAIQAYIQAHQVPPERTLFRLDGQYGTGAVVSDLADFSFVTRGKDYAMLDRADVQARLHLPADQHLASAESGICRALYDCPDQRLSPEGALVRIIVATHPAPTNKKKKRKVGFIRDGVVYELFLTNLPPSVPLPPRMWCPSICIVGPLKQHSRTKTWNKNQIAGVATRPGDRKPGRSWPSGPGTSDWSWGTNLLLNQSGRPSLPLPSHRCLRPHHQPSPPLPLLPRAMLRPPPRRPGKRAASPAPTFLFNPMGRCGVQQIRCWFLMNDVESMMAACGWSTLPAFATAVPVRNVRSANGMEVPRPNRAR
jgi:hypothetical protein